jgi:hypothetical protein
MISVIEIHNRSLSCQRFIYRSVHNGFSGRAIQQVKAGSERKEKGCVVGKSCSR